MNKHTIIVIVAAVVIAIAIGWAIWNIVAADKIQLRGPNQETFSYFALINGKEISICNPSSFYTSFSDLEVTMIYEGEILAEMNFPGTTLEPNSSITSAGKFSTENFEQTQYLSMHFDGMFMDAIEQRIDPQRMLILTEVQTQIIGVIPYSVTHQYPGLEFWEKMSNNEEYSC